jgi:hypothetical protein
MYPPTYLIKEFIQEWKHPLISGTKSEIAIYIHSWLGTAVPWYSIILGILLLRRGHPIHFIWDDMTVAPGEYQTVNTIYEVLHLLQRNGIPFYRLSDMKNVYPSEELIEETLRIASLNAIWRHKTPVPCPELNNIRYENLCFLLNALPNIAGYFSAISPKMMILPGGIFATSGIFLYFCKQNGIIATTYDSGACSISTGINSVAAHLDDIPYVIYKLIDDKKTLEMAIDYGKKELEKRFSGRDKYTFQPISRGKSHVPSYDILFPLNIENDASALGKHIFFKNSFDWLTETLDFILSETQATVVIRQHPYEKRINGRNDSLISYLDKNYSKYNRVTIFKCTSNINTYDIIDACKIILPFVSSIAVEAAIMKKIVIPAAPSFYAGFSFAPMPRSKKDYFEMIKECLQQDKTTHNNQIENEAWIAYYLSQICGRIWTDFTPQPQDYEQWSKRTIKELEDDPSVDAVLRCLGDIEYISLVQHDRIQKEGLESVYKGVSDFAKNYQ